MKSELWTRYTDLIADTEMMAYLLDSGRDEHEYSLSYLAHRYLDINYPNRSDEICDTGLSRVLVRDSQLMMRTSYGILPPYCWIRWTQICGGFISTES